MNSEENQTIRLELQKAMDSLLNGDVPGPLTGVRLVEIAGVKRHRLTHDNPDLNREFQRRSRELNRTKPEVDILRAKLERQRVRNTELASQNRIMTARANSYADAILHVVQERDALLNELRVQRQIPKIADRESSRGRGT